MTLLGDILGYNEHGNDIFGVNKDDQRNCVVCGRDAWSHSEKDAMECMSKLFHQDSPPRLESSVQ